MGRISEGPISASSKQVSIRAGHLGYTRKAMLARSIQYQTLHHLYKLLLQISSNSILCSSPQSFLLSYWPHPGPATGLPCIYHPWWFLWDYHALFSLAQAWGLCCSWTCFLLEMGLGSDSSGPALWALPFWQSVPSHWKVGQIIFAFLKKITVYCILWDANCLLPRTTFYLHRLILSVGCEA